MLLLNPSAMAVFLLGITSFVSPCVLPLVPTYLSFLTADLPANPFIGRRYAALAAGCLFIAGFALVFTVMGATASALGALLARYRMQVRVIGGGAVVALGLYYMGVLHIPALERERRFSTLWADRLPGALRALAVGMTLALGWTPCIGPALGAAMSLASQAGTAARGAGLLLVYSLGMGLPFLALAVFFDALTPLFRGALRHIGLIRRIGGALLVLVGLAQILGLFTLLAALQLG